MRKIAIWLIGGMVVGILIAGCSNQTIKASPEMPNPYLTAQGTNEIVFNDMEATCTIEIYTLAGEPVRTISVLNGNGQVSWDVRNSSGEPLVSGTYGYIIINSSTQRSGKLVIIK